MRTWTWKSQLRRSEIQVQFKATDRRTLRSESNALASLISQPSVARRSRRNLRRGIAAGREVDTGSRARDRVQLPIDDDLAAILIP